jgi:hypothetical protein
MLKVYPFDRQEVPAFYSLKEPSETYPGAFGHVFAPSAPHGTPGWLCLGYVSRRTPFGQGTYLGFPVSELRLAREDEVLAALEEEHPLNEFLGQPGWSWFSSSSAHWHLCQARISAIKAHFAGTMEN